MPFHTQTKRLYPLQEYPAVVGADGGPEVAQRHQPHAQGEGNRVEVAEIMGITKSVIGVVRLVVNLELRIGPVEPAGVDDDAADSGAMSSHPFGQGVDDHIGAVLDRLEQVRGGEGRIDYKRQIVLLGNFGNG